MPSLVYLAIIILYIILIIVTTPTAEKVWVFENVFKKSVGKSVG